MKGNDSLEGWNSLIINKASMRNIMQRHFDTVLFAGDQMKGKVPQVREVKWDSVEKKFRVECNDEERDR